MSSLESGSQTERNKFKRKLRELTQKVNDAITSSNDARDALKETLNVHIASLETSLGQRIDNLTLDYKLNIKQAMEAANSTAENVNDIQDNISSQKADIEELDDRFENSFKKMKSLSDDLASDRIAVSNLTSMYSKVVMLTKSLLNTENSTNDSNTSLEIMKTLDKSLNHLQDDRVQDAIRDYNRTMQTYLQSRRDDTSSSIQSVKDSLQKMVNKISDMLPKILDYDHVPGFGDILVVNQRMTFRLALHSLTDYIIYCLS